MAEIELRQVAKKFGEAWAVKPMDLTIRSGEFVALLGPSGCGKTTTLRMISGLEAVTEGRVYIDGKDVTWLTASQRDIAFVFQFFALYPQMTVRQNIAFPLESQGASKAEINKRIDEVVAMLRIEHLLKRKPRALSGGDKQRVALARSLVRKPACFLMDEPLGALDTEFREAMRAEIKRLHLAQPRHHRLRDARPGRGDGHGRPHRGHVGRGGATDRHAGAGLPRPGQPLRGQLHRQPGHEPGAGKVRRRRRPPGGGQRSTPSRQPGNRPSPHP